MAPSTIDPPPPAGQGQYPLTALTPSFIHVFSSQGDYTSRTGKPSPVYNPAIPIKGWIDTTVSAAGFTLIAYNTAHLDPSFQKPVVTQIQVPNFLAGLVNLPPDSGPIAASTAGSFLTPIRALLPNEKLIASPFGISVVNTDIYDPNPPVAVPAGPTGAAGLTPAEHNMLFAIGAAMGIRLSA